ncbi:putative bacilliredoxin, YphP/YqiW family [Aquiflexum balticum DSM 16537]|uniref:Putative bacilliredoxin, YphP/YqiW family n=1 Tax=Aquiflexum balticum DSM 16537 TaxID=758820 RepID=A0A1W2HB68_9BACT|nr:BrxA/BrxB family bacilliredoxin [Aquiflexum balticum]SMD46125.1 putative bacilliredoxin, YphP/YqiW family [Aquiflexum balticum DSM 16537]
MYPEELIAPMRAELTNVGFQEFRTSQEVDEHLKDHKGTTFIVINSVCGCAAGAARPGVRYALEQSENKPDVLATVFAGNDAEAVSKVRQHHLPYPPSSPSMALFKDGELVHFIERHHIEGRSAKMIGDHLVEVFEHFCK